MAQIFGPDGLDVEGPFRVAGNIVATGTITAGSGNPTPPGPLTGAGPPTSGPGGTAGAFGQEYYDTSVSPPVLYKQVSTNLASPSWMSLLTGNVV